MWAFKLCSHWFSTFVWPKLIERQMIEGIPFMCMQKCTHDVVKLLRFIAFGQSNTEVGFLLIGTFIIILVEFRCTDGSIERSTLKWPTVMQQKHPRNCWICAPWRIPYRNAQFQDDIFFFFSSNLNGFRRHEAIQFGEEDERKRGGNVTFSVTTSAEWNIL